MRALVVYESMFGNTRTIAEAIAAGLSAHLSVETVEVGSAGTGFDGVGLLVVGGPTHAFGLSRPSTREDAAGRAAGSVVSKAGGIREWIPTLHGDGLPVATFDTRVARPRLPGSAARAARRRLRKQGFRPAAAPASFWVTGTSGPLADGEADRARRWGEELGHTVSSS
jgi:hypothetical protein